MLRFIRNFYKTVQPKSVCHSRSKKPEPARKNRGRTVKQRRERQPERRKGKSSKTQSAKKRPPPESNRPQNFFGERGRGGGRRMCRHTGQQITGPVQTLRTIQATRAARATKPAHATRDTHPEQVTWSPGPPALRTRGKIPGVFCREGGYFIDKREKMLYNRRN